VGVATLLEMACHRHYLHGLSEVSRLSHRFKSRRTRYAAAPGHHRHEPRTIQLVQRKRVTDSFARWRAWALDEHVQLCVRMAVVPLEHLTQISTIEQVEQQEWLGAD
jgi:hypothetical protein